MKQQIQKLIAKISADGVKKFHVLTDFDGTLTKHFMRDSSKVPSLISILRDEGYLTPNYSKKAKALFAKYHPIEVNPKISKDKKKKAMQEWWMKHYNLLIKSKLNKRDIQQAVQSRRVQFRQGVKEFLKFLKQKNIPLVIISSSGLGTEAIRLYLKNKNLLFDNIYIISNELIWNKNGYLIGVKKPIIHVKNKNETVLKDFPFYDKIADRKNVLLLGDDEADVDMITGFDYDNLLKISFWGGSIFKNIKKYRQNYDILIKNDGTFGQINQILKQMFA